MILPFLYIEESPGRGRGVFTAEPIECGTLVEIAPVIVMGPDDRIQLDKTLLHDYIFEWGEDKTQCCMALGYVPVYNHSSSANCEYEMDYENVCIGIRAMRDIATGEELFVNYNGDWNNPDPVWFETK